MLSTRVKESMAFDQAVSEGCGCGAQMEEWTLRSPGRGMSKNGSKGLEVGGWFMLASE